MRILTITFGYPPYHSGGYEIRCKDVMEGLKKRGHEVLIITTRHPSNWHAIKTNEPGILRVMHHKFQARLIHEKVLFDILDISFLDKMVKDFKPDLIYLWQIATLSDAIIPFFAELGIPFIKDVADIGLSHAYKVQKRGLYFNYKPNDPEIKNLLRRIAYAGISLLSCGKLQTHWAWPEKMGIHFNSENIKRDAENEGIPVAEAKVIYAGINTDVFTFKERDLLQQPVKIITPGRIVPLKGTKDSIFLIKHLVENGLPVKLAIIGSIGSQPYYEELRKLVIDLELEEAIEFIPMVTQQELANHYHQSDICFFPSYWKSGLSAVPLEGMACGCLVVSYGNENSKEIIRNLENGVIVPESGFSQIADLIRNLMDNSTQYARIIEAARSNIEERFTFERYVDDIEELLLNTFREQKSCEPANNKVTSI